MLDKKYKLNNILLIVLVIFGSFIIGILYEIINYLLNFNSCS
jgi:hypothetical protein